MGTGKPKGPKGRPSTYRFAEMKVGDERLYPYYEEPDHNKVYIRVRTSVLRWARTHSRKFTINKTPDGVVFKRIE